MSTVYLAFGNRGPFATADECNNADTNCKEGFYGTGTADPFAGKPSCFQFDSTKSEWFPMCSFKAGVIDNKDGAKKFTTDFKDTPSSQTDYNSVLSNYCLMYPMSKSCGGLGWVTWLIIIIIVIVVIKLFTKPQPAVASSA